MTQRPRAHARLATNATPLQEFSVVKRAHNIMPNVIFRLLCPNTRAGSVLGKVG